MDKPMLSARQLEKNIYLGYHSDGIIDICLGLTMLLFGLSIYAWIHILYFIPLIVLGFAYVAKEQITKPRFGMVKFSDARAQSDKNKRIISIIIGIVVLCIVLLGMVLKVSLSFPLLPITLIFMALIFTAGFTFSLERLYTYAFIVFLLSWILSLTNVEQELHFVIVGMMVIILGAMQLFKFMRRYHLHNGKD